MSTYIAECYWPGVTAEHLADVMERARSAARESSAAGCPVQVRGSWLVPDDEIALVFIDAGTPAAAQAVSDRAGVACERIVEAVHVAPGET